MPLLGIGVAAIWHNVATEIQADYNHWHCFEHVPERVGIDGFLRGKRYVAIDGNPEFFHFYETENLETLTSEAYLLRLNNPTAWTKRIGPNIKDNNRTLSTVVSSQGNGTGAAILTARLQADISREKTFFSWLSNDVFPNLLEKPGIIAVHLLKGDQSASKTETEEKAMRGHPDEIADWIILAEAIEPTPLDELGKNGVLSESSLVNHGARSAAIGTYRLHFCLSSEDLVQ